MPMIPGTVSIASTPPFTATGTGLAKELFDAMKTELYDDEGTDDAKFAFLESIGRLASLLSTTIVAHVVTHAVVTSTVNPLGLVAPPSGGPVTGVASATGTVA